MIRMSSLTDVDGPSSQNIVTTQPTPILPHFEIDLSTLEETSTIISMDISDSEDKIYYQCICDSIQIQPKSTSNKQPVQNNRAKSLGSSTSKLADGYVEENNDKFLVPIGDVPRWYPKSQKHVMSTPICPRCYLHKINESHEDIKGFKKVFEDRKLMRFEASKVRCKLYTNFCVNRVLKPASQDSCFYLLLIWISTCWIPRCI